MSYNLTWWQVVELLPNTVPLIRRIGLESIPHAANGGQMARVRGLFLDISPQAHDEVVDGARIGVLPPSPNIFEHGFAGHSLALVPDQIPQQIRLHQRQLQCTIRHVQLEGVEVDDFAREPKAVPAWSRRPHPRATPQQTANARDENRQSK